MKAIGAYLIIILVYYLFGRLLGSTFFEEPDYSYVIEYGVLLLISVPNCIFSVRSNQKRFYLKWLMSSLIPGLLFMLHARTDTNTGGWISFPWDWGLWELFLPAIFTVSQIIFFIYIISNRSNNRAGDQ
ncbi:hypothetical protein [Cohnella endophytica]|uniref:hypothetical protein n=1 Tax=Cohnella endophytica TaxID=2419778 RepID=UPI001314DCD3|nr:hypothetical protein [Cohnella endophytica]